MFNNKRPAEGPHGDKDEGLPSLGVPDADGIVPQRATAAQIAKRKSVHFFYC